MVLVIDFPVRIYGGLGFLWLGMRDGAVVAAEGHGTQIGKIYGTRDLNTDFHGFSRIHWAGGYDRMG